MVKPGTSALLASQPKYVLVARALIDDIGDGQYPVGSMLPPALERRTQFGVRRHTMREAIRRLHERGMVARQRLDEARTSDVIADADLAEVLSCPVGQRWLWVRGFRYARDEKLPMAMTDIYVDATYGGIQRQIGAANVPIYKVLEGEYGVAIVEVKQDISATTIDAADANQPHVKPGSAGLVVTRRYVGADDRVLEVAVNSHPAGRFSCSMSLQFQEPGSDA